MTSDSAAPGQSGPLRGGSREIREREHGSPAAPNIPRDLFDYLAHLRHMARVRPNGPDRWAAQLALTEIERLRGMIDGLLAEIRRSAD